MARRCFAKVRINNKNHPWQVHRTEIRFVVDGEISRLLTIPLILSPQLSNGQFRSLAITLPGGKFPGGPAQLWIPAILAKYSMLNSYRSKVLDAPSASLPNWKFDFTQALALWDPSSMVPWGLQPLIPQARCCKTLKETLELPAMSKQRTYKPKLGQNDINLWGVVSNYHRFPYRCKYRPNTKLMSLNTTFPLIFTVPYFLRQFEDQTQGFSDRTSIS